MNVESTWRVRKWNKHLKPSAIFIRFSFSFLFFVFFNNENNDKEKTSNDTREC